MLAAGTGGMVARVQARQVTRERTLAYIILHTGSLNDLRRLSLC